MKKALFFLIIFLLAFAMLEQATAQNYFQDTVWMRKTDQSAGMFQVKFSNNDSIIWAMGLENGLFFDAISGEEIKRLPGNNEVFFINNDSFIKLNENSKKLEIFDVHTFQLIDTLENDGKSISKYACISKDSKYYVSSTNDGLRVWDIGTKKIIKNNIIEKNIDLLSWGTGHLWFNCDDTKIIVSIGKTYKNPDNPNNPITIGSITVFDFLTLDSIGEYASRGDYKISNMCKYIAYKAKDPTYGVEVYDFNTKELIWKLPINGPSLTGIEFSPDDKYLVTTSESGLMRIWDIETGKGVYDYKDGGYGNLDISIDGKYITTSIGGYLFLYPAKWQGTPVVPEENNPIIIYPNPTNGMVIINFTQQLPEITNINLNDINGVLIRNLFNNFLEPGPKMLDFDVSDLAIGSYFINVNNSHLSIFFKLIVNK